MTTQTKKLSFKEECEQLMRTKNKRYPLIGTYDPTARNLSPIEVDTKTVCEICGNTGLAQYHPFPACEKCLDERERIEREAINAFSDMDSVEEIMNIYEQKKKDGVPKVELNKFKRFLYKFIGKPKSNKNIDKEDIADVQINDILAHMGISKVNKQYKYTTYPCPFHNEKNGSFFVFKDNKAHCFGCGFHGDNIAVYMKLYNCDFKTALSELINY